MDSQQPNHSQQVEVDNQMEEYRKQRQQNFQQEQQQQQEKSQQPEKNIQQQESSYNLPQNQQDIKVDEQQLNEQQLEEINQQILKQQEIESNQMNFDQMNIQYQEIQKEIEESCPLISELSSLSLLEEEFKNNPPFLNKIQNLMQNYSSYRRVRRDGSCFYRAYLFKIFEYLIQSGDYSTLKQFQNLVMKSKEDMMKVGFQDFVIDDFQQAVLDKLEFINMQVLSDSDLLQIFNDKINSDSLVMYLRLATSAYVKQNYFLYEPYLEIGQTIDQFTSSEIEPIDREADQIQITALVSYTNIPIRIIYLDSSDQQQPQVIVIPEDSKDAFVTLLYRPGHYDILYN